jgi:Protein of unknown function (DUF2950)
MNQTILRRGLLAPLFVAGLSAAAVAQQAAKLQGFPSADAAASALTEAIRKNDTKAIGAIVGDGWADYLGDDPLTPEDERVDFLAAWDAKHTVAVDGNKAVIAVGNDGWTLPIPIAKDGTEWRFDIAAGENEVLARQIGHDEYGAIQTLLAIVDAENDYVERDPMKGGSPQYARRIMSSPGKKDGLYWPVKEGEPPSPLGEVLADSQFDGKAPGSHFGYNFRLLHGQGPAAKGGAHDYVVDGRMFGGFAAIASPKIYGETGVMTFIVNYQGVVYERDLGPDTAKRAGAIGVFNPDDGWKKSDLTPP